MPDLESFADGSIPKRLPKGARVVECKQALPMSSLPGLDYALNPYVGCAHDCVYCYAPAVLGTDRSKWATEIGIRSNLPTLLAKEIPGKKGTIGLGTVTDPYQPIEADTQLTRKCLEVLARSHLSLSVLTKSSLVTRDIDLLKRLPKVEVGVTITGQEQKHSKIFEPGAPSPEARLSAVNELNGADINTYVMIGPVIPNVSDFDIEDFFSKIAATGAKRVMLDRMRLRPGFMERFHSLPLMMPEFRRDFDNNVGSLGYFKDFCVQAGRLCTKLDLILEQAF